MTIRQALRDLIDAIPETTIESDAPLRVWVAQAETALRGPSNADHSTTLLRAIGLLSDISEVFRDLAAGTTPDVGGRGEMFEALADDCEQYSERLSNISTTTVEQACALCRAERDAARKALRLVQRRLGPELVTALRVRANALTGEKWEAPATAAMMKEAADVIEGRGYQRTGKVGDSLTIDPVKCADQPTALPGAIELLIDISEMLRDLAAGTTPDLMTETTLKVFETLADECEQYSERLESELQPKGIKDATKC